MKKMQQQQKKSGHHLISAEMDFDREHHHHSKDDYCRCCCSEGRRERLQRQSAFYPILVEIFQVKRLDDGKRSLLLLLLSLFGWFNAGNSSGLFDQLSKTNKKVMRGETGNGAKKSTPKTISCFVSTCCFELGHGCG